MKNRRIEIAGFFILIMIIHTYAQEPTVSVWNHRQCAVTLTYDDGLNVHLDKVIPVLDSLGFKGTFYVPGNSVSLAQRMAEWKTIASHGHELGNHTLFHPCAGVSKGRKWVKPEYDLDTYTIPRIIDEIRLSNTLLHAIDGKTKRTFAYTCGDRVIGGVSFVDSIRNDFVAARGVKNGTDQIKNIDLFDIRAFMVNGQSAEELIALVDKAKNEGGLIVFLFHGVGGEHAINISLDEHNKLLRYLKQNEKDIWIAPLVEIATFIGDHR
ncbi:MAG: polysaccharide deacetylase family protein [Bacteroidota bacterium]